MLALIVPRNGRDRQAANQLTGTATTWEIMYYATSPTSTTAELRQASWAKTLVDALVVSLLVATAFLLGCQELFDSDVWWHVRGAMDLGQ